MSSFQREARRQVERGWRRRRRWRARAVLCAKRDMSSRSGRRCAGRSGRGTSGGARAAGAARADVNRGNPQGGYRRYECQARFGNCTQRLIQPPGRYRASSLRSEQGERRDPALFGAFHDSSEAHPPADPSHIPESHKPGHCGGGLAWRRELRNSDRCRRAGGVSSPGPDPHPLLLPHRGHRRRGAGRSPPAWSSGHYCARWSARWVRASAPDPQ